MRKCVLAFLLIAGALAVLIPFASTSPDGLERVAETLGIEEAPPFWRGLMFDYSIEVLGNSYVSTLAAGISGIAVVFFASLVLGKVLSMKSNSSSANEI